MADSKASGRPTKYTEEILEKAKAYLEGGYLDNEQVIPTDVGLALHLGIARSTLYAWVKEEGKEVFSDTLDSINDTQHMVLLNKGLIGEFNSPITKLALANHGYHEKQEIKNDAALEIAEALRELSESLPG